MGITFKLIKKIGTLSTSDKGEKKLQLVSWNNGEPVYDIRLWKTDGKATSGMTFSKEDLVRIVELVKGTEESEEIEEDDFPMNPPDEEETEDNEEESEEDEEEIEQTKKTSTKKTKEVDKPKETKSKATTKGYDECAEKLDELFKDVSKYSNFEYVLIGLKELAKVDNDFVQNVMRESRTFKGMMSYAKEGSKKYVDMIENSTCITDDQMLELCIEYFNAKEEKKDTKTTSKPTNKTTTKKTTTKRTTTKAKKTKTVEDDEVELPFS